MAKTLNKEITKRWNIITEGQMFSPFGNEPAKQRAFEELGLLLINSGLLTQRPERPSERAMRALGGNVIKVPEIRKRRKKK